MLLFLPLELITLILRELPVRDICRCEQTNGYLRAVCQTAVLRYGKAKNRASVEDTRYSLRSHNLLDRAQYLAHHQRAWLHFTCTNVRAIPVSHSAGIYDCASDMFFLGGVPDPVTGMSTSLKYTRIQSPDAAQVDNWTHFEVGRPVVDFATAIEEHNLAAVATCSPHENDPTWFSVDILFLDFDTQKHHALATHPLLHVRDTQAQDNQGLPDIEVTMHIAGDTACLAILNTLYIYDWKLGTVRMEPVPVSNIGITFLAADTILVANGQDNCLNLYRIATDGTAKMVHSLLLPTLQSPYFIVSCICTGGPNCMESTSLPKVPLWNSRRYTANSADSIVFVQLGIAHHANLPDFDDLGFLFHRSTLLSFLARRMETREQTTPWWAWGPGMTRWFNTSGTTLLGQVKMTYGQRFVWLPDSDNRQETSSRIHVLDFNRHAVGMMEEDMHTAVCSTVRAVTYPTVVAHPAFLEPVSSSLPYVETVSSALFKYGGVTITDDSIVGIKFAPNLMDISSLEVLRIGPFKAAEAALPSQNKFTI
ncbi:hypothetical protein B0H13DRAFT_2265665 [Mycena leptocephala]|nr:hypothetical protein B0H13DRAFT_2265665 [Mycena leptocephala]